MHSLLETRGAREAEIYEFNRIERLRLATFFTPIEKADRLQRAVTGAPNIYIKRDDCTAYLGGGNKLRKLEYVMADALAKGATTVLTIGSIQSNHARTTAMVTKRLGLNCELVLNDDVPDEGRANLRVYSHLGIKVHRVSTREDRVSRMNEVARDLERNGEQVYKIPLGSSDDIGSFGIVAAMEEVRVQQDQLNVEFNAIILSSTSGGTQAGLEVGKRLFGLDDLKVIGVSPAGTGERIKDYVLGAINPMLARLGSTDKIRRADLSVDDSFVGEGYGMSSEESREAINLFSETEGIMLDNTYTSKAAAALISYCRERRFRATDHVLFWHTGGLLSLF
jgi:D-cysteine desulfhydrase family pyridoxal phosphate-dependent enzyme